MTQETRQAALELAVKACGGGTPAKGVVEMAEAFHAFLEKSKPITEISRTAMAEAFNASSHGPHVNAFVTDLSALISAGIFPTIKVVP